jgi:hypothetical protein
MDGFLIVDDRDGRVLAETDQLDAAIRALDELEQDDPELAPALCLVRFEEHQGALLGSETTWRVRSLT